MKNKRKSSTDGHSEDPFKKNKDETPDKRNPNPDDSNKNTGPTLKMMQITGDLHHPHEEEILDDTPN